MFLSREIAGWVLVALGVFTFGVAYFALLRNAKVLPAGPTVVVGIFLFRGGIHLLKVAVAARLCQQPDVKKPVVKQSPRLR